jgi:hypothetical protein
LISGYIQIAILLALPFIAVVLYDGYVSEKIKNRLRSIKIKWFDKPGFNYRVYYLLLLYAIMGAVDHFDLGLSHSLIGYGFFNREHPENLVLFYTLLAVLIYTLETYRLKDETYRVAEATLEANKLRLRPILVPFFRNDIDRGNGWFLAVRNDGTGTVVETGVKIDPTPPHIHTIFPTGKYDQEERVFAGKTDGDEKRMKFIFDNNTRDYPSYEVYFEKPQTIKDYQAEWIEWGKKPWDIELIYIGINGERWRTLAKKKSGEFVIHSVRIDRID